MEYLGEVDSLVEEYLLFRGFLETFRTLESEREEDRLEGLNSEKIALRLLDLSRKGPFKHLLSLWKFLESRCGFASLDVEVLETADRLKSSLFKLHLVTAKKNDRIERIHEVLEIVSQEGLDATEWQPWYALPYCTSPEHDANFAPFFKDEWSKLLGYSIGNFLQHVFQKQPAPSLLCFPLSRKTQHGLIAQLQAKETELAILREENEKLKVMLANRTAQTRTPILNIEEDRASCPESFTSGVEVTELPSSEQKLVSFSTGKHCAKVNRCRFSHDGGLLATVSSDSTLRLWSWTDKQKDSHPRPLHQEQIVFCSSPVLSLDWHLENSSLVAIGTASSVVKIWDASQQVEKGEFLASDGVTLLPFVVETKFCARKQLLATVSTGNASDVISVDGGKQQLYSRPVKAQSSLCLWSASTLQLDKRLETDAAVVTSTVFNHNGSLLVTGSSDGRVTVYDVLKGMSIMQWSVSENKIPVSHVHLTVDETAIICLLENGDVSVWSLHRVKEALVTFPAPTSARLDAPLSADLLHLGDLAHNPDDPKGFLTCSPAFGSHLEYLECSSGTRQVVGTSHGKFVTSLDWIPSSHASSIVSTASYDGTVKLYSVASKAFAQG